MKEAVIIVVYGKVQGVGFRYFTSQKAEEFNISGFVKNKPNGSVYIEAEGEGTELLTFLEWIKKGPQWAHVLKVDHQFIPHINYDKFIIK